MLLPKRRKRAKPLPDPMELIKKAKLILENGKEYWRLYENYYLLTPDSTGDNEDATKRKESETEFLLPDSPRVLLYTSTPTKHGTKYS